MPTPLLCLSGPTRAPFLPVHLMSAGQQIRGSGWQWRVGTGGQISRLMLGWGVVAEGVQDGRKCRSSMAACLHGRKCQNLVAVCACCCLCSTTHSCASKSVMVHTHFGMPSRACVSISIKAQINSNQVCATNGCIRSQKLILRHITRATTTHQLQKCAQTDLMRL